MKFGTLPLEEAKGGIAVHSIRKEKLVLKKGTKIGDAEIAALRAAGIDEITVAQVEPGNIGEDEAAQALAEVAKGDNVRVDEAFTGRANLFASAAGVLIVDKPRIDRLNGIDEAITFATLPAFSPVVEGKMIATAKIIPFSVSGCSHKAALQAASEAPLVRVAPYRIKKVGVISTRLPGLAEKVIEKTLRVTRERLAPAGAEIVAEKRVAHDTRELAPSIREMLNAGAELVLVFGASAIADRRDVIPAAIEQSGGRIEHFGMPVDPGNLMLIGEVAGTPVLGAPGCARSPKENGFDWVLSRLLTGLAVRREEIASMGVGGLLMEIVTRPQPREESTAETKKNIAAIVLAAGKSSRMEGRNKLLEDFRGKPLVRCAVENALGSKASPVIVVTGKDVEAVKAALEGLDVRFVHNPDFAEGLSSSLKVGIRAVPETSAGAIICLGDMPNVSSALIDRLIWNFAPERGAMIVAPSRSGQRGNPVLWARRFFPELLKLEGDMGARKLAGFYDEGLREVAVEDDGAFTDIDTPRALDAARKAAG
ncbi:MAG: molybdopterin-binding/glycosyltransferase family 2 protein [Xanthobacteraceae bacterium]|nr:molybdopterin-binding/glycosyltransferase family 2 protein [Xanthobacteraceae bacterium]